MNELTPEQIERLAETMHATTWQDGGGADLPQWAVCRMLAADLAPVVAAMLAEARADERQRIAASVRDLTTWTDDPDAKAALTELADRIARGEA